MSVSSITLPASAKINLDLRVLGMRPDGFHDLRTIFQTLMLHDTITLIRRRGPFAIECDDAQVPTDHRNLVWKAASLLWRTAVGGNARSAEPHDLLVRLDKQIPAGAGLGGGSADAAVTLLGLACLWRVPLDLPTFHRLAARLGSDVPFFLAGGTALGLGRGDDVYPLAELPRTWVVVVKPAFSVSTVDAYRWYDEEPGRRPKERQTRPTPVDWPAWSRNLRNDLEPAVARHHPAILRAKQELVDAGASLASMSGSGSAVFGLFDRADAARRVAADLAGPGRSIVCTRTLARREYEARLRRALAGSGRARIS
jgi:4-diphosphocytidyl-2-C-methyl-D-erythritol kinase